MNREILLKSALRITTPIFGIVLVIFGAITIIPWLEERNKALLNKATEETLAKQEIVCPTLMSIGRTSRDTLIVMRVEPLCIEYVLRNIK